MEQEKLVRSQMERRRELAEKKLEEEMSQKREEMLAKLHEERAEARVAEKHEKKKAENEERTNIHVARQRSPSKSPAPPAAPVPFAEAVSKAPVDPLKNPGIGQSPPRHQISGGMDERIKALMEVGR